MPSHRAPLTFLDRRGAVAYAGRAWLLWPPIVVAALLPILSLYAPKALPGLAGLLAASAWSVSVVRRGYRLHVPPLVGAVLTGLVVFGAASAFWSIDPANSLITIGKLTALAVIATILFVLWPAVADQHARMVRLALIVSGGAALILLAIDLSMNLPILRLIKLGAKANVTFYAYSLNPGATVLAMLLFPLATLSAARWSRWAGIAAYVLGLAVLFLSISSAAISAAIIGGLAALSVRWLGRPILRAMAAAMVLWLIVAPVVLGGLASSEWLDRLVPELQPSDYHRLLIWQFTAKRIAERPVFGWGLDSARNIPGGKRNVAPLIAAYVAPHDPGYAKGLSTEVFEAMPLHPHSLALQLWLELGAVGAAIAAALVWLAMERIWASLPREIWPALAGTVAAAFVIANLSYGAWQSWWLSAVILAIAIDLALVASPTGGPAPA